MQSGGDPRTQGELGHPDQVLLGGNRHDAGDDRHADARQVAPFAEVVEIGVAEIELSANVVGAGIHLSFQVVHLLEAVGRGGVTLGKPSDADSESTRVCGTLVRSDETYELLGVLEGIAERS